MYFRLYISIFIVKKFAQSKIAPYLCNSNKENVLLFGSLEILKYLILVIKIFY